MTFYDKVHIALKVTVVLGVFSKTLASSNYQIKCPNIFYYVNEHGLTRVTGGYVKSIDRLISVQPVEN